ncbi:MAG: ATP-binding cassette, subfamily bacterial IrtB/YbtQ [Clostridiales bacterium]|nr:ATP-binding cassette, subfamily bacterial IrtB/YbtQ [Clostridiales bacterium]
MAEMKTKPRLQHALMLTDKGYQDLKKAIAACTLTNLSMMLPTTIMLGVIMELIKPFTKGEINWNQLWVFFGLGILAALLVFWCNKNDYKKTYVVSYMESEKARTSMAEHIRRLPMSVFNSKDLSELSTNLMGDVATTETVLSHIYPQLISNAITIVIICIMLGLYDWRMAIAIFITVPLAFLIILASRGLQRRLGRRHVKAKLAASEQVQEYIEGIKVIKACNMDGERFTKLEEALKNMKRLAITMEFGSGVFITGAQVVLQAGVGLTVFVGIFLLTGSQIELIPLLMCLLIVTRIYGPILTELTLLPELLYHQIAIKRMRALLDIAPMEGEQTPITQYDICFEDVSFRYHKGGEETINQVNFTLPANKITALVGPSGSGKSTISRLIARFWDVDKGRITIGGVDIRTLDPEHLMSYMSFVFQDVVLFHDTIYNNIRIGNMEATKEQVLAAAKAARCDEFVDKLPNGYDTMLGENGSTLSGGERQRLSIARALLKDAPIVLLDEATASLDPESEASIQEAISLLIEHKTVIVIAHRLRTIVDADHIVVMKNGEVEEEGTHLQLLQKEGLYHKLFQIQQDSLGWSL